MKISISSFSWGEEVIFRVSFLCFLWRAVQGCHVLRRLVDNIREEEFRLRWSNELLDEIPTGVECRRRERFFPCVSLSFPPSLTSFEGIFTRANVGSAFLRQILYQLNASIKIANRKCTAMKICSAAP